MMSERKPDVDFRTLEKRTNGSESFHSVNDSEYDEGGASCLITNFPYNSKVQHACQLHDNDQFALIRSWAADAESVANDSDDPGSDDLDSDDVPYGKEFRVEN
jgi:hypothetical protein